MAQAGAQREPSMEEILASIRKIIENNDTDREQPAAAQQAVAQQAAPRREPAFSEVADASRADRPRLHPEAKVAKAPAAPSGNGEDAAGGSLSLADIAARMRNDKQAPVGTVLDDSTVRDLQDLLDDDNLDYGMTVADRNEDGLQEVARAIAGMMPGFDEEVDGAQAASAESAAPEPEPENDAETGDQGAPAKPADAGLSGLGQLVSVETGEKVAQSFAELDAALAAGSQRKFDEIAEELLRPMLQNWLDDNLPTMVERLIREEIERVSRGTRR
ncbi:MAG: hypothetical protein CML30_12710 [Rhizobiales bacterium]|nr:hypothetical protein [Hyphomicrobiales bacterium]